MDAGVGNELSLPDPNSTKHIKGITICRPQICHFGRRILLEWKAIEKKQTQEKLSAHLHQPKSLTCLVKMSSLTPRRKKQTLSPEFKTAPRRVRRN